MTALTRIGDMCSGHGSCNPRTSVTGSTTVFINGIGAHCVGDLWAKHCTHESILSTGSPTVFIENKPVGRIGDMVACGSIVATGSPTVNVN